MNREQIIEMAQKAGMREPQPLSQDSGRWYPRDFAERLYALAYAAGQRDMRERAALFCEETEQELWSVYKGTNKDDPLKRGRASEYVQGGSDQAGLLADAIRALPIGGKDA